MKPSKRNIANVTRNKFKRLNMPPALSKYAAKVRGVMPPIAPAKVPEQ